MPPPVLPHLAPGLRVVRRGRDRLQVGLDPARRLVLPRDAATTALLDALVAGSWAGADNAPPRPEGRLADAVLDRLRALGMLAPAGTPRGHVRLLRATAAPWPVGVVAPVGADAGPSPGATVLVLAVGEPDRAVLDPLVREGTSHLLATLVDGGARLGPLVVPGRTACLRCVDAHLAADDPEHPAVLARYSDPAAPTSAGDPDPALATLVTGWALRDLALHLDGSAVPTTWSTTLVWHPTSTVPTTRRWLRHPGCGCGWASYADPPHDDHPVDASGARPSGTMET